MPKKELDINLKIGDDIPLTIREKHLITICEL